jgi:high-affinity iron transporter
MFQTTIHITVAKRGWMRAVGSEISRCLFSCFLVFFLAVGSPACAETAPAQTIWRLLDYIAVDYPEAVANGEIVNQAEFDEMREFSSTAHRLVKELPETSSRVMLERRSAELEDLIALKSPAPAIAKAARSLAADLLTAYPVPLAPAAAPDLQRGKMLYAQHCAGCHGSTGDGKGAQSEGLDPSPIAFTEKARARERSIFALYQVIEQGLDGTSMASFSDLPAQDRWALAFYVGTLAYPDEATGRGRALWESDAALRKRLGLEKLVGTTPAAFAEEVAGVESADLVAFLRRHPEVIDADRSPGSLTLARTKLDLALAAYGRGDKKAATQMALSAYLDGFEPVEALLSARDHALMVRIEGAMAELRGSIAAGEQVDAIRERVNTVDGLFEQAEQVLAERASATSSFIAAFTILAREGLEALLIVVAMIAFLNKAGRRDVLGYVHGGWIAALAVGAGTWGAATWLITISGASRELTEGFGGLFAAAVLIWVGIWMHGKSSADAWQRYIREKLGRALDRRSAWFLFVITFVVVYREVFETILFYAAIWSRGDAGAVVAGALTASVLLVVVAIAMLRFSSYLPIGRFFAYSSVLMAVLAVVLAGKGAAALQEAGYLPVTQWLGFFRNEMLGIYPTRETLLAQLVVIALLAIGFGRNRLASGGSPHGHEGGGSEIQRGRQNE